MKKQWMKPELVSLNIKLTEDEWLSEGIDLAWEGVDNVPSALDNIMSQLLGASTVTP